MGREFPPPHRSVLLVSGFFPLAEAMSSGPRLVAREIERRRKLNEVVDVVTFENEQERRFRLMRGFDLDRKVTSFGIDRTLRFRAAMRFPSLPLTASSRAFAARKTIRRMVRTRHYDEIVVEFIQAIEAVPREFWPRVTLVGHDVVTQLYERRTVHLRGIQRALYAVEYRRVRAWERKVMSAVGHIIVLSEKDRELVRQLTGRTDVTVRPPEVDRYCDPAERTPANVDPNSMLFWGHMARPENVDAATFFVNQVMPLILAKRPSAQFTIAGTDPGRNVLALAGPNVRVTGWVNDPGPLFRDTAVGVVPLRLGAGVKIKTLEMLASGIPTVATEVGAEGITDSPLLHIVGQEPRCFAEAVLQLLPAEAARSRARAS